MSRVLCAGAVFLVGTALALATNALRSEPLPWIYEVEGTLDDEAVREEHTATLEQVHGLYDLGIPFLVDARKFKIYAEQHILGALPLPFNEPEEHIEKIFANCIPEEPVIIYCEGAECESSKVACTFLQECGFANVTIFFEGFDHLVAAGFDTISGSGPYGDEDEFGYEGDETSQ